MIGATHTATLVVTDRMTGERRARSIEVRVGPARILDEEGRYYDRHMSGAQVGPHRLMPASYTRRIDLATLAPIVRTRVRL